LEEGDFDTFESMVEEIPYLLSKLRDRSLDRTFLMRAVHQGILYFNYILSLDNDMTAVDKNGMNIIHWIVNFNVDNQSVNMLDMITKKVKNDDLPLLINHKKASGDTPLHRAAFRNNHKTIEWFLKNGVDATVRNNRNECPDDHFQCDPKTKQMIWQYRF